MSRPLPRQIPGNSRWTSSVNQEDDLPLAAAVRFRRDIVEEHARAMRRDAINMLKSLLPQAVCVLQAHLEVPDSAVSYRAAALVLKTSLRQLRGRDDAQPAEGS